MCRAASESGGGRRDGQRRGGKGGWPPAGPNDYSDKGSAVYETFLPEALARSRYAAVPAPLVVGHGVDRIPDALKRQRVGVSAAKLVITL